jgi:hypothetical protein
MKTIRKFLFLVALSAAFVSCDMLEVPVNDVEFETDMDLSVLEGSSGVSMLKVVALSKNFSKEGEVNLADLPDVKDKLDKIKSMSITKVRVGAYSFVPVGTKISGFTMSFPDLGITKTDIQGTETEFSDIMVNFTAAELTKIQDALLKDNKIKYAVSGTVSNYPVTFTIKTKYTADFKVKLF